MNIPQQCHDAVELVDDGFIAHLLEGLQQIIHRFDELHPQRRIKGRIVVDDLPGATEVRDEIREEITLGDPGVLGQIFLRKEQNILLPGSFPPTGVAALIGADITGEARMSRCCGLRGRCLAAAKEKKNHKVGQNAFLFHLYHLECILSQIPC